MNKVLFLEEFEKTNEVPMLVRTLPVGETHIYWRYHARASTRHRISDRTAPAREPVWETSSARRYTSSVPVWALGRVAGLCVGRTRRSGKGGHPSTVTVTPRRPPSVQSVIGAAQFEHFTSVWYQGARRAGHGPRQDCFETGRERLEGPVIFSSRACARSLRRS